MGNLGLYEKIPTVAKKVGVPKNLALLTMGSGYLILRTIEAVAKKAYRKVKNRIGEINKLDESGGIEEEGS